MIERSFIEKKKKDCMIQDYITGSLLKTGHSHIELKKTPLGDKVIIYTTRPGLVVGRKGATITRLTKELKEKFNLENPQIEVADVENPSLDPQSVAERIVYLFERYGPKRFKSVGYRSLQNIIDAGALGAEIVISGRGVPSSRSRSWRFTVGHLKKSGDISENFVKRGFSVAKLKSGAVGIKVSLLTADVELSDKIKIIDKNPVIEPIEKDGEEEKKKETQEAKKAEEEARKSKKDLDKNKEIKSK